MESGKPMYDTVPLADDHDESGSNTEVDDSLVGDEHHWPTKQKRRNVCVSALQSCRGLFDTFLLLVIVTLLAILLLRSERREAQPASAGNRQVGGDYTGAGPIFSTKVVKWEADMSFVPSNASDFFSNETLARWNTLMPGTPALCSVRVICRY
jgi:hypothetical protein